MKFAKVLAAASLTLASAHAMAAYTPPYHISGTPIVGTATFKAAGGCKVAPQKFSNAQYGTVKDSTNATVGTGVIDASGNTILATYNSTGGEAIKKYYVDNGAMKARIDEMVSFVGPDMLIYMMNQAGSGCQVTGAWATPNSALTVTMDSSTTKVFIKQSFVSYLYAQIGTTCEQNGSVLTCPGVKKVTGAFTFKTN